MRRVTVGLIAALAALLITGGLLSGLALADFPYLPKSGGNLTDPTTWKLAPGEAPTNFHDDWKFAATPEQPSTSNPANYLTIQKTNSQADELCGVRGASIVDLNATMPAGTGSCITAGTPINTAFEQTTGRPDVLIAVLDSGIEWNNQGAMVDLRNKVRLNAGELPAPRVDLAQAFDPSTGVDCSKATPTSDGDYDPHGGDRGTGGTIPYDVLHQGVFNVRDYACDSRVAAAISDAHRHGPAGFLTPEDLVIAFSDGIDHDHNGFANDIVGWNFVDNTNDPYDDVQYGHGTGEARDSNAEANTTGDLGTCPNCMVMPLRVGESFIADVNRFAQAVLYATDRGASVVQEALGTLNSSYFARQAIDYAYYHGTTVIASAADEAAEHHNQPGALPHTIVVNSVVKYADQSGVPLTGVPPSYLQLNGCTNFSTKITLAVPSSSCSSEATGKSSGVAGLIYSAALNAIGKGQLAPSGDCTRVDGTPCPVTPNEVRQLMASGNIAGQTVSAAGGQAGDGAAPADAGSGAQADDVNFAQQPEPSCSPLPAPGCTDPNSNSIFALDEQFGFDAPLPDTRRYHARKGFDEFYGYGRMNAYKAVQAVAAGHIPPQADITSPDWFQQLDPAQSQLEVDGYVNARSAYTCRVDVAPGGQPNNALTSDSPPGDFQTVPPSLARYCDGTTSHSGAYRGPLALIDVAKLEARFPPGLDFAGNEHGGTVQTSNGRPNTMPYAFTVRVVVSTKSPLAMTGEDRRQLFLHRDKDMLTGFPKELRTDGASSPLLVDLVGENRNQLVVASSDGWIHAYRADGSELPGWPVHTDPLPLHAGEPAYASAGVGHDHYQAVLGALAAGDLFHDGRVEVVADDLGGHVYAWDGQGRLVFKQESNPAYSGSPLAGTPSWWNVRQNPHDRTEHGFLASPALAHLDGNPDGRLDVIVAGEDRHVYAWQPDPRALAGSSVPGFPVLVEDPDKIAAVDPVTHHLAFSPLTANVHPGIDEDQGKLVDTPAVAALDGPGKPPSLIVGSNEEYAVNRGDEGAINAGALTAASLGVLGQTGVLSFANGRLYVIKAGGGTFSCAAGKCSSTAFAPGWPKKIGIINRGLLPDVGEGINGSPVTAPLSCPSGGAGAKIGVAPDAGPAYIFNADGSSCYGQVNGADNPLEVDFSLGNGQYDHPAFAAVGYPAFGTLDGQTTSLFTPEAGLIRALDVVVPDYQGGQDFIGAWDTATGQQRLGFPAEVNDLQFLTGPVVGDILGIPGQQQLIGGTASLDLAAFNAAGLPASTAWPKLTGDWTIATPTLGSLGTLDSDPSAHKVVVSITRAGTLAVYKTPAAACSPSSSPRFHHDNANSGDYTRDAVNPGVPVGAKVVSGTLSFSAPGADLMCADANGKPAAAYQVVTSGQPITAENFASATPVAGAPAPGAAGAAQIFVLPAGTKRYIAIRAENAAHNVGLPAVVDTRSSLSPAT